jgi:hypothetical protein
VIALGGHLHVRETLTYEIDGTRTLFAQSAAIVAPTTVDPLRFPSGVTLYSVRNGMIDRGRFIALDGQRTRR